MKNLNIKTALKNIDKAEQATSAFSNDQNNWFNQYEMKSTAGIQFNKLRDKASKLQYAFIEYCVENNITDLSDYADLDSSGCGFESLEEEINDQVNG